MSDLKSKFINAAQTKVEDREVLKKTVKVHDTKRIQLLMRNNEFDDAIIQMAFEITDCKSKQEFLNSIIVEHSLKLLNKKDPIRYNINLNNLKETFDIKWQISPHPTKKKQSYW